MESLPIQISKRPTIALAMIVKNEIKNMPRLLESVKGCFDAIHITDTGSNDGTVDYLNTKASEVAGCQVNVHHFQWVNSFSKARNYAFSHVTEDYVVWMDADDIMWNKAGFISWRDAAMQFADFWFASYHYAVDKTKEELTPIISFVRERAFRNAINPQWSYDLHEGVLPQPGWRKNYATTWSIKHMRDEEDTKADRSRNITMIEEMAKVGGLDGRMQFYYGKELYEAGRASDSIPVFEKALEMQLESHDRILALQYGGYAALGCFDSLKPEFHDLKMRYFNKCLDFAHKGIQVDPNRAEFYALCGDAYLRINNLPNAVPYFAAAKACLKNFDSPYEGAMFSFKSLYGEGPSVQLAKIYAHLGQLDKSKKEAQECIDKFNNEEARNILLEVEKITNLTRIDNRQEQHEDILISCPPHQAYEFDEELYKTKAMGGSETALIQMAKLLKEKTGRPVKVFNSRSTTLVADSGVEYIPNSGLAQYVNKIKPYAHIAWRHNIKLTNAPSYLWCHDLITPTVESVHNFDKMLCLSEFSKGYVSGLQGVPTDKIIVTRNGIDPSKFNFERKTKNPNKIVWMSSPDRGLDRAMKVCDLVRQEFPDTELHVYYGIEGLYKYGPEMSALADKLKVMMEARSYVKYHGFTEQSKMYYEVSDAVIWVHPCDFIETFCITALECLANGIFPVTRRLGALQNTLADAVEKRQAILIDHATWDDEEYLLRQYAKACCRVILNRQWENITFDLEKHSWSTIADEWIEFMGLTSLKEEIKAI